MATDSDHIKGKIVNLLHDGTEGARIHDDLRQGFGALPIWMQDFLRGMLDLAPCALGERGPATGQE